MRQYQASKQPDRTAHPLVKWVWREMNRQKASQEDVAARAGVSSSAMRKWRTGDRVPLVWQLEAVINVLGGKLEVRVNYE